MLLYSSSASSTFPGSRLRTTVWQTGDMLISIPAIGMTHSTGQMLLTNPKLQLVRIKTSTRITLHHTFNVIADLKGRTSGEVVMIGAHLDSVPAGPGINDNGSGSSLVLELAKSCAKRSFSWKNGLRFAWWGAEEIGLLGSHHYVKTLLSTAPAKLAKIQGYLNFDMEGGPNYIMLVYNGTDAPVQSRTGSEAWQHMFERHFVQQNKKYAMTSMDGGSDFLPFILGGVPSSGLATGASGLKSADDRAKFGGLANAPLDPCYHASCDTVANVNRHALLSAFTAAKAVVTAAANQTYTARPPINAKQHEMMSAALGAMQAVQSCGSSDEAAKR